MSAQRFIGANSRDAMNQVRAALGEDALILSSRMTDDGVEIMAMGDEIAPAPLSLPEPSTPLPSTPAPLRQWLLDAGFSAGFSEELLGPALPQLPDATPARLKAWLMQRLDSHLKQLADEAELFKAPTVIALVGPTGVGKTTTTAKLAARYVMRHGPENVALVTTDSFRVGAHEQLNIYAGLLDVELHALGPNAPLGPLLSRLAGKRLVIATATVALQEQIVYKDLPDLMRNSGLNFTFALAKGRGRYMCLSKLDVLLQEGHAQTATASLFEEEGFHLPA